jgi:hypothetical protein
MIATQTKTKPAATEEHGLSPHLIKAKPDYRRPPFVAWSLVILCTSSFYLGPLMLLSPLFLYPFHPEAAKLLFCAALFLAFHPVSPWPRFRKYCQLFYTIFNFHHNMTPKLDEIAKKQKQLSIIAVHPHAIIPLHGFIWGAICDQLLPHMYGYGCTTDGAMHLPVLRHVLQYLQTGSAHKKTILHQMQQRGQNLFILPGGVAEIFLSHRRQTSDNTIPNTQTIKARRYGLMKLALETGAAIYPTFVFGASDLLDQLTPAENEGDADASATKSKSIGSMMQSMSRKLGGGLTLYYGKYYLPIPHTPQLSMVLGNPIYPVENSSEKNVCGDKITCKRVANPTAEQVEELMDRYVDALQNLFEQYKEEAGYPNETLKII